MPRPGGNVSIASRCAIRSWDDVAAEFTRRSGKVTSTAVARQIGERALRKLRERLAEFPEIKQWLDENQRLLMPEDFAADQDDRREDIAC